MKCSLEGQTKPGQKMGTRTRKNVTLEKTGTRNYDAKIELATNIYIVI